MSIVFNRLKPEILYQKISSRNDLFPQIENKLSLSNLNKESIPVSYNRVKLNFQISFSYVFVFQRRCIKQEPALTSGRRGTWVIKCV
jgi:hypothetical protein